MAERESVYLWSTTALTNGSADTSINFAEGQLPGTVNNSARSEMAALARFIKDTNGSLTTAGSANAYTLTINGTQTAYATGHILSFKASFTNTAAATLNVTNADAAAIGAKALRRADGTALLAGDILQDGHYRCEYDAAANSAAGAWLVVNVGPINVSGLTEDTSPDATADFWVTYDTSASALKKVKPTNLVRERLTASRTYFVRTDGSDANTGLVNSAGGAKLTLQGAWDAAQAIDANGNAILISVADGTYTGALSINKPILGAATTNITGNTTTPANVVISCTNANAFLIDGHTQLLSIQGFKITVATAGDCFIIRNYSNVSVGVLNLGASAGSHFTVDSNSTISHTQNYTISGGTGASGSHHHVINGSRVGASGITITLTGTPAFGGYFCGNAGGYADYSGTTFSGSATGQKYYVHYDGVLRLSGVTLPGSVAGVSTGGNVDDVLGPLTTSTISATAITCTTVAGTTISGTTGTFTGTVAINNAGPTLLLQIGGTTQSFINDAGTTIAVSSNAAGSAGLTCTHGASAWVAISDERLDYKKSAREIDASTLPDLAGFHLYENEVNGHLEVFVKAQEFNRLFPHNVKVGDDDPDYVPVSIEDPRMWGVSYDRTGLWPLLYIKQQAIELVELKARIAALEALIAS